MHYSPEYLLSVLLNTAPQPTALAPQDACGLYGLVDHKGDLRYIGSTKSTFYERIHNRHRTGSEDRSHHFSHMYNTGRIWRDREDKTNKKNGLISKKLRREFVVDHCRAVWVILPVKETIAQLEKDVLDIAPEHVIAWNRGRMPTYEEPADKVDATLHRLG